MRAEEGEPEDDGRARPSVTTNELAKISTSCRRSAAHASTSWTAASVLAESCPFVFSSKMDCAAK